jgi:hypothetical protein
VIRVHSAECSAAPSSGKESDSYGGITDGADRLRNGIDHLSGGDMQAGAK